MNSDIVLATVRLVERAGASGFDLGYLHDDVPVEKAGWWAHATYQGARILVDNQTSPTTAALALAERLLRGATCRCRQPVTLNDTQPGCRWRLVGDRWEPGCDAPSVKVEGNRGDYTAMQNAMRQPANRAERRKTKKKKK